MVLAVSEVGENWETGFGETLRPTGARKSPRVPAAVTSAGLLAVGRGGVGLLSAAAANIASTDATTPVGGAAAAAELIGTKVAPTKAAAATVIVAIRVITHSPLASVSEVGDSAEHGFNQGGRQINPEEAVPSG